MARGEAVYSRVAGAAADLLGEFALEEVGDSGGELDDFEAASGFASGVGEDFAVLAIDEGGDFVEAALEDFTEAEEDAGAAKRRLGGPVGEGRCCSDDGGVDFGFGSQGDSLLDAASGGVEDVGEAVGCSGDGRAGDPVMDFGDGGNCGGGEGCGGGHKLLLATAKHHRSKGGSR